MFDINFFKNTFDLKKQIVGHMKVQTLEKLFCGFEQQRNAKPFVFNIETTNNCNMTCVMCPRTTEMTRNIRDMDSGVFQVVADQIAPHKQTDFASWTEFIEKELGVHDCQQGENPFYFFVSSRAVTMHGFGDPLLDRSLKDRVEILSKKNIPTYFSCNPSNINMKKVESLFQAGVDYIKFSIDSVDEDKMKKIRGHHASYTKAYDKIMRLIDIKEKNNYSTKLVLCMIKLHKHQDEEIEAFHEMWKNKKVDLYVKSLDNQWYWEDSESDQAKSHYASQYCEFPWTSLTVMVDGTVVPCTQDFNCAMPMGNVNEQSLEDIWNSEKYKEFRMMHINGEFPKNYRCPKLCDLKLVADYL